MYILREVSLFAVQGGVWKRSGRGGEIVLGFLKMEEKSKKTILKSMGGG